MDGHVTAIVDGNSIHFGPGETLYFPKGTVHTFFNPTSATAVVTHPIDLPDAFPDTLMLCLSQIWGMTNDPAFLEGHTMALQISILAPLCDLWDGGAPVWLQRTAFYLVAPTARLLGYRAAYAEYVPHDL